MKHFSVKCKTKNESYEFARLAERLNIIWRNEEIFTSNTNRWTENGKYTHYNVHVTSNERALISFGSNDDTIRYEVIPCTQFNSINSWEDVNNILETL